MGKINKIIAVMSGKGGVGKSFVTSLVAINLQRQGYKVGVLDADITGPSIPKIFGVNKERAVMDGQKMVPVMSKAGTKVMSLNLLLQDETQPVIWRGPLIGNTAKQFYEDTAWGDLDYLVIDLPPGTADVTLTVMQSIPIDGMVIVTCPQDLVRLIVEKSVIMAEKMNIPILGLVENMSYATCPDCGEKINIFGESKAEKVAKEMELSLLGQLPIQSEMTHMCDLGTLEQYDVKESAFVKLGETISNIMK